MYTYCVTFRISDKTINGKTYAQRREMLINNVRKEGRGYWEETTSFFLVESPDNTNAVTQAASKGLSPQDDILVVFDPSDMSMGYFGPIKHLDVLKSFFAASKKVP